VQFLLWLPVGQEPFVTALLRAAYPGAELRAADVDPTHALESSDAVTSGARVRVRARWVPLRTDHSTDALAPLLATLARAESDERVSVALAVRPRPDGWQVRARQAAARARRPSAPLAHQLLFGPTPRIGSDRHGEQVARSIETKASQLGFDVAIRVLVQARDQISADEYLRSIAAALRTFAGVTSLEFGRVSSIGRFAASMRARAFPPRGHSLLTPPELAALWHLPAEPQPHVEVVQAPKLPPPLEVPRAGRLLALANYPGRERPVATTWREARRHALLLGATGAGKSALLANLVIADLEAGHAVVVFDPGGTVIDAVLPRVPAARSGDVVLVRPDDPTMSVSINPLEGVAESERELVAEQMLAILATRFATNWGPRSDDVAKSLLLSALHRADASLCLLAQLLADSALRRRVLGEVHDPLGVGAFWAWFDGLSPGQQLEVTSPLANKLRDFLVRPRLRRLLCGHSTVDLRRLLDGRGILLIDLAPGKWGPGAAELVGSFLLAKVWQAAQARAARPPAARPHVGIYVDEFQDLVSGIPGTLESALAQARKYGLALTLATQSLTGLPRASRGAVITNCRTKLAFALGLDDARRLATEFAPLTTEALLRLGPYELAARLAVDGHTSPTFTARALPPLPPGDPARAAAVAAVATARWTRPVADIDAELLATLRPGPPPAPDAGVGRRRRS
jgi:hypothetical protein